MVLTCSYNAPGLAGGTYNDTIMVQHNADNRNSPIPVAVRLTVYEEGIRRSRVIAIGPSTSPSLSGQRYRMTGFQAGAPLSGEVQGTRFRLILE
jgi:hypothetical protein